VSLSGREVQVLGIKKTAIRRLVEQTSRCMKRTGGGGEAGERFDHWILAFGLEPKGQKHVRASLVENAGWAPKDDGKTERWAGRENSIHIKSL